MNCKQGDLAVIVKSTYGHEGKIVKCLRQYNGPWVGIECIEYEAGWEIDIKLRTPTGEWAFITDDRLRPLRDNPGTDETLTWAPVPSKVAA